MKNISLISIILQLAALSVAQTAKPAATPVTYLKCGSLFDGKSDQLRRNVTIIVEGEKIREIATSAPVGANTIDLGNQTCLPGLIDVHTHLLPAEIPRWSERFGYGQPTALSAAVMRSASAMSSEPRLAAITW